MTYAAFLDLLVHDALFREAGYFATQPPGIAGPSMEGVRHGIELVAGRPPWGVAHAVKQSARWYHEGLRRRALGESGETHFWKSWCRYAVVFWVADVLSAAMVRVGRAPIVPIPSKTAEVKAVFLLGRAELREIPMRA